VVATGAAGAYFDLGFSSLVVGSTGLGVRLGMNQEPAMRLLLAVASSAAFLISLANFLGIGYALVGIGRLVVGDALPSYLLEEGGILISAMAWLMVGIWLLAGVALRGVPRATQHDASGSRQADPQPRVR